MNVWFVTVMKSLCTVITSMEYGGKNVILDVCLCVDEIFSLLECYLALIHISAEVSGVPVCPIFKKTALTFKMELIGYPET